MATMYEISGDLLALNQLMEGMVDDEGNPRDPTPEEYETMKRWFEVSSAEFDRKFDSYCKFIKNLKIEAEAADGERKAHKAEIDRLSKRARALSNKAESVRSLLWWGMQRLKLTKYKTALFSAGEQNGQVQVSALAGAHLAGVPERFLKPRELDTVAIKEAIRAGELRQGDGTPQGESKLFFKDGSVLPEVRWAQGKSLVIR